MIPVVAWSCMKMASKSGILVKSVGADDIAYAKEIEESTAITLAKGLKINLWATDSLAQDPIALAVDDQNRFYISSTNRQKNSEFDIRGHRDWMTESIGLQSVEERRAFLHKVFDPTKSSDNEWLPDLNGDGSHDWKDLTVEKDEVWRLEDTDGDGHADKTTLVLKDFNEEITDVAGALLVRKHDAFVGIAPDLWRIEDTNGDGYYDKKTSIAHGFQVHIGFGGHGMSGLIEGPDGKIYWGIGDIGANITDKSGKQHFFPNQGVIVRCNPDGSNFEVFSHGHRNTHEFVFDQYGNIISEDNDGDHPGESERLVHIVEGSDSGWRTNWQFGKYTDPKNNLYKPWMDEEMYKPRHAKQASYFIPPIRNYHNGPTGMLFNPGTALGKNWLNKFFIVEFTGTPSRAHIWSFDLKPKGASFDFNSEVDMVNGVLATGIRFGTDGALYAADWINGWNTKDYGRIWKVDVDQNSNDLATERQKTMMLMAKDYESATVAELNDLLYYADMRIRQKAQFELVNRPEGMAIFKSALSQKDNQLARVHAVWGIGQLSAKNPLLAQELFAYLDDSDPEIIAQVAKTMGDLYYVGANEKLISLLDSKAPRVQFFAAQALGRAKCKEAVPHLLGLLSQNNDEDVYIRHAAVLALSRIEVKEPIRALVNSPERSLRLASVLVLRKWQDPSLAGFLTDKDEYIIAEAARAINDDFSVPEALPALANLLKNTSITDEVIVRRAINAALRVGGKEQLDLLIAYAENENNPKDMRAEALATIGVFADPSVLDRVTGRYRGEMKRDAEMVRAAVIPHMATFLKSAQTDVIIASIKVLENLKITGYNSTLEGIFQSYPNMTVKAEALKALSNLDYAGIEQLVTQAMQMKNAEVRTAGLSLLNKINLTSESLQTVVDGVFENGETREKQQLMRSMAIMPLGITEGSLNKLVLQVANKTFPAEVQLDLSDAIDATGSETLKTKLRNAMPNDNPMDEYMVALTGGNAREGYGIFNYNSTAQCVRCHALNGNGGSVGPDLTNIGKTLTREQILEALVMPSERLAPGYGSVLITLKDGQEISGILMSDLEDELILKTSEAEPMEIAKARIARRENMPSGMPPMGLILQKKEIRDLVEFLSRQGS